MAWVFTINYISNDNKNSMSKNSNSGRCSANDSTPLALNKLAFIFGIIATLLLFIVASVGLTQIQFNSHYSAYFSPEDDNIKQANYFAKQYGNSDSLIIAINDEATQVLSAQRIIDYSQLQLALEELPYVVEINSFYQNFLLEPWLEQQEALSYILDNTPQQADLILAVMQNPKTKRLISVNEAKPTASDTGTMQLALIEITTNVPKADSQAMLEFSQTLDEKITPLINSWQHAPKVYYSGTMALNKTYFSVVRHDIKIFIPSLLIVFSVGLWLLFRSKTIATLLMANGFICVYLSLGILCLFGIELTAINVFAPVIIITLSIATNAHLVMSFLRALTDGLDPAQAITSTISTNQKPYSLSLVTTALGFLLLATSPSPPIQAVGFSVALAMAFNLFLGLVLLPKLLVSYAVKKQQSQHKCFTPNALYGKQFGHVVSKKLNQTTQNHLKKITFLSVFLMIVAMVGFSKFKINDDVYQYFPPSDNFTQGIGVIEESFGGISPISYELSVVHPSIKLSIQSSSRQDTHERDQEPLENVSHNAASTVFNTEYVELMLRFKTWADEQAAISEVISPLFDLIASEAENQIGNPKALSESALSEKTLASFEQKIKSSALPKSEINKWLKQDLTAAKFIVRFNKQDAASIIKLNQQVQQWFAQNSINTELIGGSGPDLIFAKLGQRNASSMLYSLAAALIAISLLIGCIEKSIKIAFISVVCNLFPVVVVYGIWSLFGGYISLGVALVMGMVMGIIVDDTLHVMLKRHVYQTTAALLDKVAPTIIMTSIIIIIGLAIGLTSSFTPIRELSLLTMCCIAFALFADLFLLPRWLKMNRADKSGAIKDSSVEHSSVKHSANKEF